MRAPLIPEMEEERQASLDSLQILDTPAEDRFDRITRLTTRIFGVPISLVTLVDRDRQWFKSEQGMGLSETSREISFCAHAINDEEILVVPDTLEDERFRDNPMVTGVPGIRFYAGHPLRSPEGHLVGTLCAMDRRPREMTPDELEIFRDLAALVESELHIIRLSRSQMELVQARDDAERKASIDSLTRAWNRDFILEILNREISRTKRDSLTFALVMLDLDRFKSVNDTYGHQAGDVVLRKTVDHIRSVVRPFDAVGRYGGEEFMIILIECNLDRALLVTERIRAGIEEKPILTPRGVVSLTTSQGVVLYDGIRDVTADDLIDTADTALYRAKDLGRNRVEIGTLDDGE